MEPRPATTPAGHMQHSLTLHPRKTLRGTLGEIESGQKVAVLGARHFAVVMSTHRAVTKHDVSVSATPMRLAECLTLRGT